MSLDKCCLIIDANITFVLTIMAFQSRPPTVAGLMNVELLSDEGIAGSEPNTVSLRREIAVLDENDNRPVYHGRPYAARVPESAKVGSALLPPGTITVSDDDGGVNADVVVRCVASSRDDDVCEVFDVATEKV